MNYLKELNIFYHKIDSEDIPANAILLWYTLMSIANSLYWKDELTIALSVIESKSKLSKPTIWRMRKVLEDKGWIKYRATGGRACGTYKLIPFDGQLAFHSESLTEMQNNLAFHSESITETQNDFAFHSEIINKHNKHKTISNKENIKRKNEVAEESAPLPTNPEKREKEKSCAKKEKEKKPPLFEMSKWLETLEPPWQELMQTWLEYKSSRKERYKSEMSVSKCLAQLQRLSEGKSDVAQQIIDQSIANNWAGLFELKRQAYYARNDTSKVAKGQHIGQILQPESEEKRNKILASFGKK